MSISKETLYIRADMNAEIATGHMMRCLSIADAAVKLGASCVFILADEQAKELVTARGHQCIILHTIWNQMERELPALTELIQQRKIKHLLIDSYSVTYKYLEEVSKLTEVTYIDDVNAFAYPVDQLICYANYYKDFDYDQNRRLKNKLLGCAYVPLRGLFYGLDEKKIAEKPKKVLLLSGGSDQYHILSQLLERFSTQTDFFLTVVCGKYNEDYDNMCRIYEKNDKVQIFKQLDTLFDAMQEADLAVSAGGTTLYELCACGTPTITYAFVDNQLKNVEQFEKDGIMRYAGDIRYNPVVDQVMQYVEEYQSPALRKELSKKMQEYIDGKGAERICRAILAL